MKQLINDIVKWLEYQCKRANRPILVVGVSGGIDSAVTSALCAMTDRKLICVNMPINQAEDQITRSDNHILFLKENFKLVDDITINLTELYNTFYKTMPDKYHYNLALANSKARLRMTTLYQIAGSCQGLVVGTGNKVEDFGVGFFTKYGDGGVDISPIADLMKSEVYKIGEELNINNDILEAAPTDGLWDDGRTDEEQLGVTYNDLEWAMENGDCEIKEWDDEHKEIYRVYKDFNQKNSHKMEPIPVFKKIWAKE